MAKFSVSQDAHNAAHALLQEIAAELTYCGRLVGRSSSSSSSIPILDGPWLTSPSTPGPPLWLCSLVGETTLFDAHLGLLSFKRLL